MGNLQSVPEHAIDKEAMSSTLSGMKAARNAIDMGKHELAENLLTTIINTAQVPLKSKPGIIDEDATRAAISAMTVARRSIKVGKSTLATQLVSGEIESVQSAMNLKTSGVVTETAKAMFSAIEAAHHAVNGTLKLTLIVGKYDLAASIIVKLVDSTTLANDLDEFIQAASEHQARCSKHPQAIMYLSQTLTMYEHAAVLRPDNKIFMGLLKACSDDLDEAKEKAGVKKTDV